MRASRTAAIAVGFAFIVAAALAGDVSIPGSRLSAFAPLPSVIDSKENPLNSAKIRLGRLLYYDPRLSANQKISCNTCHPLDKYGVDSERVSTGVHGQQGTRNSPTVYNAAGHIAQFWDGREPTVEAQAGRPMMNPVEMGMTSEARVVQTIGSIWAYRDLFRKSFPGQRHPITFDNAADAIAAFERGLMTPSRWDRFLKGDRSALTEEEQAGFNTFYQSGCAVCHNGAYLGGSRYERLGLAKPWPESHDPGRAAVTHRDEDRNVFKVPSLRNVAMTAPYYHDGSVLTLDDAVSKMGEYQLGRTLTPQETASIELFLKTLTGDIPREYIAPPTLPPSRHDTPKPLEN